MVVRRGLCGAFHNQGELNESSFFVVAWKLKTEIHKRNEHIKTECGRPIRGLSFLLFFVYLENAYFVFKCLRDVDCRRRRRRSKRKMHQHSTCAKRAQHCRRCRIENCQSCTVLHIPGILSY